MMSPTFTPAGNGEETTPGTFQRPESSLDAGAVPVPDCMTCGACCASPFVGQGYIQVSADEEKRLGRLGLPVLEVVADPHDRIVLLGTKENSQGVRVCIALAGRLGKQVACTIYEDRPSLCRQFEAGSPECHQARQATGMT